MEKKIVREFEQPEKKLVGSVSIEKEFSDQLDIIQHALTVHHKESRIPNDLVMFECNDKDRKFITTMHKIAWALQDYIADKNTGKEIASMITMEEVMLAVLKRNNVNNPIVGGAFAIPKEIDAPNPFEKLMEKIGGSKKS